MIEAESQLRLCCRDELLLFLAPGRRLFSCAKTQQQRLVRQRNGRAPIQAERSEVRHGGDSTRSLFCRDAPAPGQIDQFVVIIRQLRKRSFIGPADDGNHDSILCFDRDANIDRLRPNRTIPDQARRRVRLFREGKGEGAQNVQRRAGFRIAFGAVFQNRVEAN